jgi:peptidyl-prolyl cis-trans isomerase C
MINVKVFAAFVAFSTIPAVFAQAPAPPKAMTQPNIVMPPSAAAPPAAPVDPAKVILTIGDQKITAGQYDELVNSLPAQYQSMARGPGKRQFAEQLVQVKLLAEEAEKTKLADTPKIKDELAFQRENLLAGAMFQHLQETIKVTDADIQKYYDQHKSEFEVLKARHILIRVKGAPMAATPGKPELTDEEAKAKADEIRKRLLAGEDFATVAKAESDDKGSGANGGDLGDFHKGMMVPQFEQAAFAAKIGEVTEPVKTPFGYHLIKVEAHTTKPLAEVKAEIETKLRPELARQEIDSMRKTATVQLDDSFFGPVQAPRPVLSPGGPPPPPPPPPAK